MNTKQRIKRRIIPLLLAIAIISSGITIFPATVQAAGWLDAEIKEITLGEAVSGSIKEDDYYGEIEEHHWSIYSGYYWNDLYQP